jgi:hypothetical protein
MHEGQLLDLQSAGILQLALLNEPLDKLSPILYHCRDFRLPELVAESDDLSETGLGLDRTCPVRFGLLQRSDSLHTPCAGTDRFVKTTAAPRLDPQFSTP